MVHLSRYGDFAFLQKSIFCVFDSTSGNWSYLSKEQNCWFDNYLFHQKQLFAFV